MHLRQVQFTYSASGQFTKNKGTIQKFKETENSRYFYQNELDNVCFQHDIAYGGFKDLPRRTPSDKVVRNKTFIIAKIQKTMDIKEVLFQ